MFVTNWISTTKIQKISEITNFFRHYFLSRTEVANVDDERMVNALEHIWIQLRLDASHRTRLSVTLSINHVDNTVVFHCLNIGNVTDCNLLASHTTTNQEYIGRGQTLVWYFLFCN